MGIHPFYISWTSYYPTAGGTTPADDAPTDDDCRMRFGPTTAAWSAGGMKDGLQKDNSKLPCIVSILSATQRSLFAKRRYANYVFGAAWDWGNTSYMSYGSRKFFNTDYESNTESG